MPRVFYPLLALLLAGGAFIVYWSMQHPGALADGSSTTQLVVPGKLGSTTGESIMGLTQRPWSKQYDAQRRLVSQFRAEDVVPQADGSYLVAEPEMIFHLSGGRRLHLQGRRGVMFNDNPSTSPLPGSLQQPTRGQLFDVTIRLMSGEIDLSPVIMRMNNAVFDAQLLHVYTDSYKDPMTGEMLAGDQVPVTVRGIEADFDGRGLEMNWNDRDRRVQLLEIAHGGRAVLKRSASVLSAKPAAARGASAVPATDAATPQAINTTAEGGPAAADKPAEAIVIYRATFSDNVRVSQNDKSLIVAAGLMVDYATGGAPLRPAASTTVSSPSPAPTSQAGKSSTEPGTPQSPAGLSPAPRSEPIILTWTGPLKIVPITDAPMQPIDSGQAAIRFTGDPVRINLPEGQADCASLTYQTDRRQAVLGASAGQPVVSVHDARGMRLDGEGIDYAPDNVVVHGKGHAILPNDKDKQTLIARWTESATFHLRQVDQVTLLNAAELRGSVEIEHPQLALSAKELDLTFDSADRKAKASIKSVSARGDVSARVLDSAKKEQHVRAEELSLALSVDPAGRPYATAFAAAGNVRAGNDDMQISAGRVTGAMRPAATTQPLAQIESLNAKEDVRLNFKGSNAIADTLSMRGDGEQQMIELTGAPSVEVSDAAGNRLRGSTMQLWPNVSRGRVPGAGTLRLMQVDKKTPIDLTWAGGLAFDLLRNQVVLDEKVTADMIDASHQVRKARAGQMVIVLDDSASKARATGPMGSATSKQVKSIALEQKAELEGLESAADGKTARTVNAWAERMIFDPNDRTFSIPVAGRMLIESEVDGLTGMTWHDRLSFDDRAHKAEVVGAVVVVHQGKDKKEAAVRLECPHLLAEIADADQKPSTPVVKRVVAQAPVRFTSDQMQFESSTAEYHPFDHTLSATGSAGAPAQLFDSIGTSKGSFDALQYDVEKRELKNITGFKASIRR